MDKLFLYDTHAHLEYFSNPNEIVENAAKNNVKYINNICVDINEFAKINAISQNFSNVFSSIGQHPCNIDSLNGLSDLEIYNLFQTKIKANLDKIIAIGEICLDYYHNYYEETIKKQNKVLSIQLEIAKEYNLPVVVHTRNAENATVNALSPQQNAGVIHCFTGTKEFMKSMLDLGFYISFSGIVTFKKAEELRSALAYCPIDQMLIETDAPYLAPEPFRGKQNMPEYVNLTAKFIANFLNINYEQFAMQVTKNSISLFNISSKI